MKPKRGIPIWWCLDKLIQQELWLYQLDNFGTQLNTPPMPEEPKPVIPVNVDMTLEEIAKFMAEAPSRSRGNR